MVYRPDMQTTDSNQTQDGPRRWWSLVRRETRNRRDLAILFGSVVMTLAAFVFNMGWIRLIFLFTTMPIILMGLHTFVGFAVYWQRWHAKLFYVACILHPLSYILLYDSGDSAPAYIFFGQIPVEADGEGAAQFLVIFAMLSFMASFAALITLKIQMWLSRKRATKTPA